MTPREASAVLRAYLRAGVLSNDPEFIAAVFDLCAFAEQESMTRLEDLVPVSWLLASGSHTHPVVLERIIPTGGGSVSWAVRRGAYALTADAQWVPEPFPLPRNEAAVRRCRFATHQEALAAWDRASGRGGRNAA